jgi:secondary thiamine-phosphate synthase enzyme
MVIKHQSIAVSTIGKGTYEITEQVETAVRAAGVVEGLVNIFIQHTSCSLCLMENADPSARRDLQAFFDRLVPEDASYFIHTAEGPDDMPSHIRTVLTRSSETIPVSAGRLLMGTWQGIFLFEHRRAPHTRTVVVTCLGT